MQRLKQISEFFESCPEPGKSIMHGQQFLRRVGLVITINYDISLKTGPIYRLLSV